VSECSEDVYDKLERAGTFKKADNCTAFLGVHDAVLSAVESNSNLLSQVIIRLTVIATCMHVADCLERVLKQILFVYTCQLSLQVGWSL